VFSLIITLVSIALVAALVSAALYYGGSAMTKSREVVDVASLLANGQQIVSALILSDADQTWAVGQAPVVTLASLEAQGYLRQAPEGWTLQCEDTLCQASYRLALDEVSTCAQVNAQAGLGATTDLTVFTMATSLFYCQPLKDGTGGVTDYVFVFNHNRA